MAQELHAFEVVLEALVNQNSYTRNPDGGNRVATMLEQLFAIPGLDCDRVPSEQGFADHLLFCTPDDRDRAPTALIGHLDTVFPPGAFEGYRADGELRRGPGVLDMKGGLVTIAFALRRLVAEGTPLPALRIVIVSDEEVGSPEGRPLIERAVAGAREALVFESGRTDDLIITQRKGTGGMTVTASGKAAHAGNAHAEGANAIDALATFIVASRALTDYDRGITVSAGKISGGIGRNTVPDEASLELDLRVLTLGDGEELIRTLRRLKADAEAAVPGATLALSGGLSRVPMERTPGNVQLYQEYAVHAHDAGLGHGEAKLLGGGSDGNSTSAMGIPTIDGLGPRGLGFHTREERIEVASILPKITALTTFLRSRSRD